MSPRTTLPVIFIALPIAALLSSNCGVFTLPTEVPHVIAVNAQSLKFTVNIVDAHGHALDGVTIKAIRYAIAPDMLLVETGDIKNDKPRIVDQAFDYNTFGNYAVRIEYSKPHYETKTVLYANQDSIKVVYGGLIVPPPTQQPAINVKTTPHTTVILYPDDKPPATKP